MAAKPDRKSPTRAGGAKKRPSAIYVLNGPNLNLLGAREPEVYGRTTLAEIGKAVDTHARAKGFTVTFRQTNHEGELIDWLQEAGRKSCGVILNAAAYTHTSVGLHDAIKALDQPLIEVHLSNPYAREPFRHHSYVSPVASGVICGFKETGYILAIDALASLLKDRK